MEICLEIYKKVLNASRAERDKLHKLSKQGDVIYQSSRQPVSCTLMYTCQWNRKME